jgi:cysteine desulfuration protein SufE
LVELDQLREDNMQIDVEPALDKIRSDLALLDDWEDRYRYLIELGRNLEPFPDALRTDANKVRGCASQVWLASSVRRAAPGAPLVLEFQGDSDAHIVRGLVAVLFAVYQGKTPTDVLRTDARSVFAELGVGAPEPQYNGFFSMVGASQRCARRQAGVR